MLVLSQSGITRLLDYLIAEWNANLLVVKLFRNDYVPQFGTTLADLVESNFSGYAPITVSGVAYQFFSGQVGYLVANDSCQFTVLTGSGGPQLAFGYWVEDSLGNLLWAERDPDGPVQMSFSGNSYNIIPRLGIANCPP